ncbi:MAG: DNA polymerase IV [Acidimicrobiales bacterium]
MAAASYEARAYGVRSAMPSVRARRLCPQALFLPADHATYSEASKRIMALFAEVTPLVEPLSLDEAFLDVTGAQRRLGSPPDIAARLRARVLDQEQLTCSVGVASTKFLAKLASEEAKPTPTPTGPRFGSGVFVVPPGGELAFLHPLPVRALWGVGPATLSRLERLGVSTVGDLAALPLRTLVGAVGDAAGRHLHELAHNRDPRTVEPDRETKSIGHEETFPTDRFSRDELDRELLRLGDGVARRLREANVAASTVTIKVRFGDFTTITRSQRQPEPVDSALAITRAARSLLAKVDVSPGVRLIGVSTSGLAPIEHRQLTFDLGVDRPALAAATARPVASSGPGPTSPSSSSSPSRPTAPPGPTAPASPPPPRDPGAWQDANDTVDAIRRRFGAAAIGPGSLAAAGRPLEVFERGRRAWGPDAHDGPLADDGDGEPRSPGGPPL